MIFIENVLGVTFQSLCRWKDNNIYTIFCQYMNMCYIYRERERRTEIEGT